MYITKDGISINLEEIIIKRGTQYYDEIPDINIFYYGKLVERVSWETNVMALVEIIASRLKKGEIT